MRIPIGSAAVGADAGEEVVGGFGEEAVGDRDRRGRGAGKAVGAAADAAVEMNVHVVAGVVEGRWTGFIFCRACAVVDDMHKTFLYEEGKGARDRGAVYGVECLLYFKRRQRAH